VFDWPKDGELVVPGLKNKIRQAYLLADRTPLEARRQDADVIISLPAAPPDPINSVVVLKVDGALDVESPIPALGDDGVLVLSADAAYIHNNEGSRQARVQQRKDTPNNIGYWTDANAWVEWSFKVDQPGRYEILAELAVEPERSCFRVESAGQQKAVQVRSTGSYYRYAKMPLGTISIDQAGKCTLSIKPEKRDWHPINLRQIELKRQ
jgi:alpha-L-fucosidase